MSRARPNDFPSGRLDRSGVCPSRPKTLGRHGILSGRGQSSGVISARQAGALSGPSEILRDFFAPCNRDVLAGRDSNPDYQGQNLACCRYTTRQGPGHATSGVVPPVPTKGKLPSPSNGLGSCRPEAARLRLLQNFHSAPAAKSKNASDPREAMTLFRLTRILFDALPDPAVPPPLCPGCRVRSTRAIPWPGSLRSSRN
jgi:hypothetical protein